MDITAILTEANRLAGTSPPLNSEEYEDLRVKWSNDTPGDLTGYHCPDCLDKGFIIERRGVELVSVECECMVKRRNLRRIRQSGLSDMLSRYTFDAYQTQKNWQKTAKSLALDYANDPKGKWFVAAGTVGSGKTHLCTAICGDLMNSGMDVRYMLWRDESVKIKAAVNDQDAYNEIMRPLKKARVLYIDDFFKAGKDAKTGNPKITEGDINLAFELLNARYNQRDCMTIISTELTMDQIMDVDSGVGSRIYERSKGYYLRIVGQDKNWRLNG